MTLIFDVLGHECPFHRLHIKPSISPENASKFTLSCFCTFILSPHFVNAVLFNSRLCPPVRNLAAHGDLVHLATHPVCCLNMAKSSKAGMTGTSPLSVISRETIPYHFRYYLPSVHKMCTIRCSIPPLSPTCE